MLKLQEFQEINPEFQEVRRKESYQEIDGIIDYESLAFDTQVIWIEVISPYYDYLFASYFDIKRTCKLVA